MYKIVSTMGGVNGHIDNSKFSNIFSFLQDYSRIAVIPFPHLNTINFTGMTQKDDYVIWRENGEFFTAMDSKGLMWTWSKPTGKIAYFEDQSE